MNIAVVKESLAIGGNERSASNISQLLAKEHRVYTILFNEKNISYTYGGKLVGLSLPPKKGLCGKIINSVQRSLRIRRAIKQYDINLMILFTSITGTLMHEPFSNCKKVIMCRDYGRLKEKIKYFKHAVDSSEAIIFNSKYQRDFFLNIYPHMKDKCFVSYNIIDKKYIIDQSKEKVEQEYKDFLLEHEFNIVAVGRFCYEKGFENLINSFAKVVAKKKNVGLVLVGNGDFKEKYEKKISEYKLGKYIYFTGFKENPYKYMKMCNLFILSSITEGFPNVVPEAMACGLPVLCTNCLTGPAEILNKEYDYNIASDKYTVCDYGILVPRLGIDEEHDKISEEEMSKAILRIIDDKQLRDMLSKYSLDRVDYFSKEKALFDLNEVISYVNKQ